MTDLYEDASAQVDAGNAKLAEADTHFDKASELVTEANDAAALNADSNGVRLEVGDLVAVSRELTTSDYDYATSEIVPAQREQDFGTVTAVNTDGTVTVQWDAAGCSCTNFEGRSENSTELEKVDPLVVEWYWEGYDHGYSEKTGHDNGEA